MATEHGPAAHPAAAPTGATGATGLVGSGVSPAADGRRGDAATPFDQH
ncbi:hypothetical protein ACGF13_18950 [Kitasatospora sp. NPDC048286]